MLGSRPNLPEPASDNVLRVLQISSKSVHVRRSYGRTRVSYQEIVFVDKRKKHKFNIPDTLDGLKRVQNSKILGVTFAAFAYFSDDE